MTEIVLKQAYISSPGRPSQYFSLSLVRRFNDARTKMIGSCKEKRQVKSHYNYTIISQIFINLVNSTDILKLRQKRSEA